MRAIHGGKSKNDKIDSRKIAALLRGGLIPMVYVYPQKMRATRDLMRRRNHLMRKRAELLAHIQNTASQYNLDPLGSISKAGNRKGLLNIFDDHPEVMLSVAANQYYRKISNKHGKGKALSILAHKLVRAVYFMLKNRQGFDMNKFLSA